MFMYERYTVLGQSVKNLAQSNIFEAGAVEISELFGDYLEGDVTPGACVALALGETSPSDAVRNAIARSLAALGYGENACTFATLLPFDQEIEGADIPLDAQSLFLLVEGLDPLRIIVTDRRSADLLASAYRTAFPRPHTPPLKRGLTAPTFRHARREVPSEAASLFSSSQPR